MNERISNIFDYGDEIVVVKERDDRIDPARIKELTMDKIKYGGYRPMDTKTGKKALPAGSPFPAKPNASYGPNNGP